MTTQNTALKLTTQAAKAPAKRPENSQTRAITALATLWNSLDGTTRSSWATLAGQITHPNTVNAPSSANAYALFIKFGLTQQNAGGTPQTTAPPFPLPPKPLPPVSMSALFDPGGSQIIVHPAADYPDRLIVYASSPRPVRSSRYPESAFAVIGSLTGLSTDGTDISALYFSRYFLPSPGYEIAIKLVGVTPGGFRAAPLLVTTVAQDE